MKGKGNWRVMKVMRREERLGQERVQLSAKYVWRRKVRTRESSAISKVCVEKKG